MHALNTNEEIKMKKINYFGKEYTVGDDIKWVATNLSGNVFTFTEKPEKYCYAWVASEGGVRIDIWGVAACDWKNSLRKVEDIIVKENELKVGDKVMVNRNINGFKKGQIVEVYRLDSYGCHLFKGDNDVFPRMCGIHSGAFLSPSEYTVIDESKPHTHADMMLKYAQIAQHDDKPWEHFECDLGGENWFPMVSTGFFPNFNYRLKPQEPKIQAGQIWVSKEGVDVMVDAHSDKNTIYFKYQLGGLLVKNSFSFTHFLQNFKRKE